jgi:hypothetical protein
MKQGVFAVLAVLVLVFIMSGGFSVADQAEPFPSSDPRVATLLGEGAQTDNDRALQLRTLKFTYPSPSPSTSANPSAPPSTQPSPSATPNCQNQPVAVDLLIDTSGSMCLPGGSSTGCPNPSAQSKIAALKNAVLGFVQNLQPDDVIGIQEFNTNAANLVTPDLVSNNIGLVNAVIPPIYGLGQTYTRDGFEVAIQQINARKPLFPNHQWYFIFLSDGVPETTIRPDETQNPLNPPNLANQIKQQNIRIFSIGLNLEVFGPQGYEYATNLMKGIASSPTDANFYDTPTASQLNQIYQEIANKICR